MVAVKIIKNVFGTDYQARKVLREVSLLRQLSEIPGNVFTTQLYHVIIPGIDLQAFMELRHSETGSHRRSTLKKGDNITELAKQRKSIILTLSVKPQKAGK